MSQFPLFQFGPMIQQLMGMMPGFMGGGPTPNFDQAPGAFINNSQQGPAINPNMGYRGPNPAGQAYLTSGYADPGNYGTWQPGGGGPSTSPTPTPKRNPVPGVNWGQMGGGKQAVDYQNNPGSFRGVYAPYTGNRGGYAGIY